jgi:dynein light intermediate chain
MFPPIQWEAEGKMVKQVISTNPPSREDVNSLQKLLDEKLVVRQARDSGICPIREELHRQCFD